MNEYMIMFFFSFLLTSSVSCATADAHFSAGDFFKDTLSVIFRNLESIACFIFPCIYRIKIIMIALMDE